MADDLAVFDILDLIGKEDLTDILKEYVVDSEEFELNNFDEIIENAEVLNDGKQVKFKMRGVNIILNSGDFTYYDAEPAMPTIFL